MVTIFLRKEVNVIKKILAVLVLSLAPSLGFASQPFGLGIIIGAPTGFSAKYKLGRGHAIDGALAWAISGHTKMHLHADYLWVKPKALKLDSTGLDFFFGVGARLSTFEDRDEKETRIGVRAPAGLSYQFRDPRIELFGEVALIMNLISSTSIDIDAGIGARYFF